MSSEIGKVVLVVTTASWVGSVSQLAHAVTAGSSRSREPPRAAQAAPAVSEDDARVMALVDVPGGWIQDSHLETYDGRRVWAVAVRLPHSFQIVVLRFDAATGERIASRDE